MLLRIGPPKPSRGKATLEKLALRTFKPETDTGTGFQKLVRDQRQCLEWNEVLH